MRRARTTIAIGALAAMLAAGCRCPRGAADGDASAPPDRAYAKGEATAGPSAAAVLKRSAQCGSRARDGSVRWLASAAELERVLAAASALALPDSRAAESPEVDFETSGVLHVEMGQRPTAGYALDLATEEVAVEDGTGVVRVNWTEPPEDGVVAQVVTSPCLLVTVRKEGLRKLEVVDQAGRVRGTVEVR